MYLCRTYFHKKKFLWSFLCIQLFLIGLFFIYNSILNNNGKKPDKFVASSAAISQLSASSAGAAAAAASKSSSISSKLSAVGVKFINNYFSNDESNFQGDNASNSFLIEEKLITSASGIYENEFLLNKKRQQPCFRDGLIQIEASMKNQTHLNEAGGDDKCICQIDYHGSDCGLPEVLWRAFMTAKMPLIVSELPRKFPHKIFYLIHTPDGGFVSLETLEIQIMELISVVDLFILCDAAGEDDYEAGNTQDKMKYTGNIKKTFNKNFNKERLIKLTAETGLLKKFRHKILLLSDSNDEKLKINKYNSNDDVNNSKSSSSNSNNNRNKRCSLKTVYTKFRQQMAEGQVKDDDIILVSKIDEILNLRAIKYFKWYDRWPQPAKFRLKYIVYGYYWQHPDNTRLGSVAAQINVLDEIYKCDPWELLITNHPGIIIGDLNHAGGWYCQYCYHPLNIVEKLFIEKKNIFINNKQTTKIDSNYIEQLISNGLFVDGKLPLNRLHRFADKYYAPEYITNSSWKYEGLLSNVYATYDDEMV